MSVQLQYRSIKLIILCLAIVMSHGTGFSQTISATIPITTNTGYNDANIFMFADGSTSWLNTKVAVNPTTNRIYVAGNDLACPVSSITEINGSNNSIRTFCVERALIGIGINPQTNRLYLPDHTASAVTVVDLNAENVQVISVDYPYLPYSGLYFSFQGEVAVNTNNNRIYFPGVYGGLVAMNGVDNSHKLILPQTDHLYAVAVNSQTNHVYVTAARDSGGASAIDVIDGNDIVTRVSLANDYYAAGPIAVNERTNRIYLPAINLDGATHIIVMNGDDNTFTVVPIPEPVHSEYEFRKFSAIAVNPATNRVYVRSRGPNAGLYLTTLDGNTNAVTSTELLTSDWFASQSLLGHTYGLAVNSHNNLLYIPTAFQTLVVNPGSSVVNPLPDGSAEVTADAVKLSFTNVASGGAVNVTPIDPAAVGQVPGGFSVSDSVAYEISTTANFTGPVTLAFKVPSPISQEDFNNLAILHNENGTLIDVTATTPPRDYANLTIYATATSFSPFYLACRGSHIKTLFDQTKAYKRGSTIPIKLQVLNTANANLSSSSTALATRDLRLMSGNTLAPFEDSGNANPDYTFRYDSTLGGSGGGYIFNLSTKGLASGQYVLSFYVGSDRSFFYTVKFEVK